MLALALNIGNTRRGISLQKIYSKYNWRNMWSGENGTDDGTTLTAIDYTGNDNLSNPALANKPTLTYLNGKGEVKYDGVDDYLIKNVSNWRGSDTEGQIIAVIETGSDVTNYHPIFATSDVVDNNNKVSFGIYNGGFRCNINKDALVRNIFDVGTINANTTYIITFKSTGTGYEVTINGVLQTLTFVYGSNDGMWLNQLVYRDNISSGGLIQKVPFYAAIKIAFVGYAPSNEPTLEIVNDLNKYYHIF